MWCHVDLFFSAARRQFCAAITDSKGGGTVPRPRSRAFPKPTWPSTPKPQIDNPEFRDKPENQIVEANWKPSSTGRKD